MSVWVCAIGSWFSIWGTVLPDCWSRCLELPWLRLMYCVANEQPILPSWSEFKKKFRLRYVEEDNLWITMF